MSQSPQQAIFTQIDVSNSVPMPAPAPSPSEILERKRHVEMMTVLREMLVQQRKQNDLLQQLVAAQSAAARQRMQDLCQWRNQHPELARDFRRILKTVGGMQSECFRELVDEAKDKGDGLAESEYLLTEFIDRFGPRLMHLNGILQTLSTLASPEISEP
ncbi:MAG: hypothetical protein Q4D98_02570 [Planctomycetia bacterium]|nr:hypothetical protein [Planctomycetia bacterium]